jgi:WD40 repeat protein
VIGDDFNLIKAYEPVPGRIYDAHFNTDGSRFAVASSSDGTGEVRIYETDSGKLLHKLEGQKGAVYAVAFSTSGKVVASAGFDGLVRLNDAETGKLIKEFSPVPTEAAKVAVAQ